MVFSVNLPKNKPLWCLHTWTHHHLYKHRAKQNFGHQLFYKDIFVRVIIRFRVQFGINLHLRVFQKAEIALAEAAHAISAFLKTHKCILKQWCTRKRISFCHLWVLPLFKGSAGAMSIWVNKLFISRWGLITFLSSLHNTFSTFKFSGSSLLL